jgi:hypothetical protein
MKLIKGNSYILVVEGTNQKLTYTCKIIDDDEFFVTFVDKLGKTLSYRKDKIISFEEIGGEND